MQRGFFLSSLQSECRIVPLKHSDENIVLQAVMDEFDEHREKGNLTAELLNREKVRIVQPPTLRIRCTCKN